MATNSELIAALACEDRDYIMGRATKALRESVTSILAEVLLQVGAASAAQSDFR